MKYVKLFEEFIEGIDVPYVEANWYEKNDWAGHNSFGGNHQNLHLINAVKEVDEIEYEFSERPYDLVGTFIQIYGDCNAPQLIMVSNISEMLFKMPYITDTSQWVEDLVDINKQKLKLFKKSRKLDKPILSILAGYEGKTYVANPLWNKYWEEGLTKLVTEICPLEECDKITQNEIINFAKVNGMLDIINYCFDKDIDTKLSDSTKKIYGKIGTQNKRMPLF